MKLFFITLSVLVSDAASQVNVTKYLQQFGYYNPHAYVTEDLKSSLKLYQKKFELPQTGYADAETINMMMQPRCGVSDLGYNDRKPWTKKHLTYNIITYTPDLTNNHVNIIIAKAFAFWSSVSGLSFSFTSDPNSDIKIAFARGFHRGSNGTCKYPFNGPGGVLAHAFPPTDGNLHFDDDELFTDNTYSGTNLLYIATHEIGHTLSLTHSYIKESVMYPRYLGFSPNFKLHNEDIRRIRSLYGNEASTIRPACRDVYLNCSRFLRYCNDKIWGEKNCKKTCNFC